MSWGKIPTSHHVRQNSQVAVEVVDFHYDSL
jgi:hypothetical protein